MSSMVSGKTVPSIASLAVPGVAGRIGIMAAPGSGGPSRSAERTKAAKADLDHVAAWGATVVVTLLPSTEMAELGLSRLSDEVRRRHMGWLHLPIDDYSIPNAAFETAWRVAAPHLHRVLGNGFDVLIHCHGGRGRSGMIAARLLIEAGPSPDAAIVAVRGCRAGAIETKEQEQFLRDLPPRPAALPTTPLDLRRDRAVGALVGLAIGDAVGTTLEFTGRDDHPPLLDMVGGGPFRLKPGQWTDDTAMALALADSLLTFPDVDANDLMTRFVNWWRDGAYSCTGTCFDIGTATREALARFVKTGDPLAGSTDAQSAGNGSLMRLAPVSIRHSSNPARRNAAAAMQSRTTHAAAEAVDACLLWADILADAINGDVVDHAATRLRSDWSQSIAAIAAGSWRGKRRHEIQSTGYVVHTLEAALWAVGRTTNFVDAVLQAANLGGDADTTAAVTGQLAGAVYGLSSIPLEWRARLAWAAQIETTALALIGASGSDHRSRAKGRDERP